MDEETIKNNKSEVSLREESVLEFWNKNQIFKKTLDREAPNGNFVFYDGPPFATGLPHYGHVLPGTIKDLIPRYQTMKGKRVLRRWGWDCHGLPIENLIEKELGLKSKKDIEVYGVEKFNLAARNVVFRYADEWKKIIPRVGRWVDMENDYRTMDPSYTESVWWSFKTLHDKGLVYQDFKSMLLCPHCETTLSNFEINQGYKDITDISVYVEFELVDSPKTYLIAWTTTPWTLPGNVALAINPEIEYVAVEGEVEGKTYIIAKSKLESVFSGKEKSVRDINVKEILGKKYKPIFNYYDNDKVENRDNAWKVYAGSFVTADEGTGIVHIAPAFGEEDMNLGKENNLPFVQHVNRDGTFKSEVIDFAGQKVKPIDTEGDKGEGHQKTDIEIIKYLAKNGSLFSKKKIVHSYPHCWRCGTPLLNYATTSWFVKVTAMKDRLVEINKKVEWTPPEIGEGRFGKWLEGARDWAISRSRYWGAPLPVWENKAGDKFVLGSLTELKEKTEKSGNKYFVMRHGETEENVRGVWNFDIHKKDLLTKNGEKEVEENANILKKENINLIITSPFYRTQETAEMVAHNLGLSKEEIISDDSLCEWGAGEEFNGKPIQDYFDVRNKSENRYTFKTADGESYMEVIKRAGDFLYNLENKYSGKNILIVTHGAVCRALNLVSEGYSQNKLLKHTAGFINFNNAEIRELAFVPLPHNENFELDLHRPYIDDIKLLDKDGQLLKRVPEVFDTWYDSGSMPFAQQHYPFENKEEFEKENGSLFPADFIAEGLDQTRGWFYTLLVLSVGLFDKSPYQRVLVNGLVLAEDGRKMSKSLNNYPDLMLIVNKYGADALRYYLMSSPLVKSEDFNFSEKGVDDISKKLVQKIYNVLSFYELYPSKGGDKPEETVLDTWILSRLSELNTVVTASLDKYELDKASRPILDFVDDLSTWYIRRSRDRFKSEDNNISYKASYFTAEVLLELSKIMAPFTPFLSDEIYRRVGGKMESVHLENWPGASSISIDLIESMKKVRETVTQALELRQKAGHKVRQPLASLTVVDNFSPELLEIIADEVNVKEVKVKEGSMILDTELTSDLKNEGIARDIVRGVQDARKIEGLNPHEKIKLIVFCSEEMKLVINSYSELIKSPTQITEITFAPDIQNHKISLTEEEISISILK
ncbi:class I tRNA ligase family protein [Patescibacteria group bacterium]|nr:class I tRNA ligase family protein [Patescibacteria group bacterium]